MEMTYYRRIQYNGLALAFTLLCALSSTAGPLQGFRDAWHAAETDDDYAAVAKSLIAYRKEARFAKTAEVDYMIATSLCHVPEFRSDGVGHFDWILASYNLGPDRDKVEAEKERCASQEDMAAPAKVAFLMLPGQGGASEIRSKLYYWVGKEAAINTEPVEIVSPKTPEELSARLFTTDSSDAARNATRERVGSKYVVVATDNFVLASAGGHTMKALRDISGKLEQYMGFFVQAYRMRYPSHLVTVYLVPDARTLQNLANKLHGIKVPTQSIGYAFMDDLSILGVIPGKAIGTLAHELFHMMVRDRYGDIPPWLDEGTASLYEVSNVSGKYLPGGRIDMPSATPPMVDGDLAVRGTPNWRGCVIRSLWIEKQGPVQVTRPTLSELAAMDWSAFNNLGEDKWAAQQAMIHATARYFILYLQEKGKLFEVFEDFATRDPSKIGVPPAVDAKMRLATHLGELSKADTAFENWLRDNVMSRKCQP